MFSSKDIKQALKNEVESRIYSRGSGYFRDGQVRKMSIKNDKKDGALIVISGEVEGSETYDVALEYDAENNEFWEMECTCPYGDTCKHMVALGLAFADWVEKNPQEAEALAEGKTAKALKQTDEEEQTTEEKRLRETLRSAGLADKNIPEGLIAQLLQYQKSEDKTAQGKTVVATSTAVSEDKTFDPKDYCIVMHEYDGYTPTLYEKARFYQQTSPVKILARKDLTPAQRDLLTYIKEEKFGNYKSSPPDPAKLFPLLVESGLPIYKYLPAFGNNNRTLVVDIHPKPLETEIVYESQHMYEDETKIRYDFFLRMPEIYWNGKNIRWSKPFHICDSCVIRDMDENNTIELHQLTPSITKIISRLEPVFDNRNSSGRNEKAKYHQAKLTGEELVKFDRLADDASRLLTLTSAPLSLKPQAAKPAPHPAFLVDFDNTAQTLQIAPVVDYGIYKQDISESVYLSRRDRGDSLQYRPTYENPGTHIIRVTDDTIYHAKINKKKELDFYRKLIEDASDLGFTKTLKCRKNGQKQLTEYFHTFWPTLTAYAQKENLPIVFSHDELPLEQTTLRADFATDINTENDLLYFDLDCYCDEEHITLEKLMTFLQSDQPFWRKDDGTLVEISNREELERLAQLLKSFETREEGGFESKLYRAPELEYVMTSSEHYNAVRAKSFDEFLSRVKKGKPVKKVHIPVKLSKILRPYQKSGIEWLYFLRSYRFAGILADDMGLGKTLQTLAVLDMEKVENRPSVVVCPKTLLYNWQIEAEKFFPKLKTLIYDGSPKERLLQMEEIKNCDLMIVSYGTLRQDEEKLSTHRFNYAVLDEAQFIKNHATKSAQTVKKLNADYRLALTGTPLENNVSELWSIYDFLMPGFLGNYENFAKTFHRPIMDSGDREALKHLRRKIEFFMLRRTKAEVLKELPPKIESLNQCHLSEAQNVLYQQILAKVRGEVFGAVEEKGFKGSQIHILAGLMKLRQACNHPALLTKDKNWHKYESAKLDMCMELVDEVVESRRKVLIFSQFTQMLDIVSSALEERGIEHLYLSGKTRNRQQLIDKFNTDPTIPVFLISLKAGGTGLNLTSADTVIIFDPWWNPGVENQAIDRTHRIGQTKTVNVYRLSTRGTIEEKIQALKQKKQLLFNAMVEESGDTFKKLTWDDVQDLFAD